MSEKPMSSKEHFDSLFELAKFRQSRRDVRYQAILRVSVGLWAIIAAAILYLKPRLPEWVLIPVLCCVVAGHMLVVRQMQLSNWVDMNTAFYYIEKAEHILFGFGEVRQKPKNPIHMSWMERWASPLDKKPFAQAFWTTPTIMLTVVAYILIGRH
jgi:hypothetical protein